MSWIAVSMAACLATVSPPSVCFQWRADVDLETETVLGAVELSRAGTHAFVVADGVIVVDISDPLRPEVVASWSDWRWSLFDAASTGDVLVTSDTVGNLVVLDVSTPSQPVMSGRVVELFALEPRVSAGGSRVVASDGEAVAVIDVSDPSDPRVEARVDLDWHGRTEVAVDGDLVYVGDETGLRIFDLTDPTGLTEIGYLEMDGPTRGIAVRDGLVVLTISRWRTGEPGILVVVDVATPSIPVEVGRCACDLTSLAWFGDDVVAAGPTSTVTMIDVSPPVHPAVIGTGPGVVGRAYTADVAVSPPFAWIIRAGHLVAYESAECVRRRGPVGRRPVQ